MANAAGAVRTIALVGPNGAGKTTLLEALLYAAGAIERQGAVGAGASVGDASPEARAAGQSVELNFAHFEFMGDRYAVVDCPGSVEFCAEMDHVLPAVDLALVVADPDPAKAGLLQPVLRELERLGVPHALFVNRIDQAHGRIRDLLAAMQPLSSAPLVARQLPIWEDEHVAGFVDLALERAFVYRPGKPSQRIDIPAGLASREAEARFHMLEQLADFDDELMEQLLSDLTPPTDAVFADLVRETRQGRIAPVFFGSAFYGFGVRRLLKALRHDTPPPELAAQRLGADGPAAYVLKVSHVGQAGKLAYARVFAGALSEGAELTLSNGGKGRASGLFKIQGLTVKKVAAADPGDIIAIGKVEGACAGELMSLDARARSAASGPQPRMPLYELAIAAHEGKDEVRLSGALGKLLEEDVGLRLVHDPAAREVLLKGQGEAHLRITIDRLKRRFGVEVAAHRPSTGYRETIRKGVTQRGRHKKQTGGHGQFADVTLEIRPLSRGEGFVFSDRITGGVVPRQWIPAVEQGVRDALEKGPLGFPVVDVTVALVDGAYHNVDSSELAFRTAGRIAMSEGLQSCQPVLLEPIEKLTLYAPSASTSKITSAISARRGQILGFDRREDWRDWDRVEVYLPQAERRNLIVELRSLTQGLGVFEAEFDHMAECAGRSAGEASQRAKSAA